MAQNFPIAEKFTLLLHAHVAPHSNPPNFRMHLNVANNLDFYSPEKQFQNQLTKVSNYKQAASTRCGPTGIQDWSWDPRRRGKCRAQSTLGKMLIWVPRTSTQWEKALASSVDWSFP